MPRLAVVDLSRWTDLGEQLAARYPKSKWRVNRIQRGLTALPYWRVPTVQEAKEQTGGISTPGLMRRRAQAASELAGMAALPRLTASDELPLLEQRQAFGFQVDVVRPSDRFLSFYHVWAICDRRQVAALVCRLLGNRWLVPLDVLEEELRRRTEVDDVEVLKLHASSRRRTPDCGRMLALGVTF